MPSAGFPQVPPSTLILISRMLFKSFPPFRSLPRPLTSVSFLFPLPFHSLLPPPRLPFQPQAQPDEDFDLEGGFGFGGDDSSVGEQEADAPAVQAQPAARQEEDSHSDEDEVLSLLANSLLPASQKNKNTQLTTQPPPISLRSQRNSQTQRHKRPRRSASLV